MSVVLDAGNRNVTLPEGYYGEVSISTTLNPTGDIKYRHHVHSTTSTEEYVETATSTITTDGEADSYVSSVSGGCFTTPKYGTKKCTSTSYRNAYNWRGGYPEITWTTGTCTACGNVVTVDWHSLDGHKCGNTIPDPSKIVGYTRSCGITRGEIVQAVISY